MRINKYIAMSGICSRRQADDLVKSGKVKVNGKVLSDLAFDVSDEDIVVVDKKVAVPNYNFTYLAMHKPKGCVSTNSDEHGRKTVFDLLPNQYKSLKLFCVGRLDYNTEGLLILTNDGELTQKITHPSNKVYKRYIARVEGVLTSDDVSALKTGVVIDGHKTAPCLVTVLDVKENKTRVEVSIHEGRNRQVRKMFEAINKNVDFLVRKSIGEINLGGLKRGDVRELANSEIAYLKGLCKWKLQ